MADELLKGCRLIPVPMHGDDRGRLVTIEGGSDIPFVIARIYYIYFTEEGVERGFHAHRSLRQVAIAIKGSCTFVLDDGQRRVSVALDTPEQGLLLGPMIWREMTDFSPGCVLLVLADAGYDEQDYIRDYAEFRAIAADAARLSAA